MDLGRIEYVNAMNIMIEALKRRAKGSIGDLIIFCEHSPVYTVGKAGATYPNEINGIPVYKVERGGDITFHGPEQIVGYPIIKLDERRLRLTDHIRIMEEAIINVLRDYGLKARWIKGHAGVWVENRKIASIGIAVDKWVTYHGFAFNINTDLSYFSSINPCGLDASVITSLEKELGKKTALSLVRKQLINEFEELYGEEMVLFEGIIP